MGCTSSAQNMPPSHVNSGKGHSHEGHEVEHHAMEEIEMSEEKGESKETQVLPTCDTVDSHTISKISHTASSPDLEKGSRGNGEVIETGNSQSDTQDPDMNNDDLETEEKLEHLEEVVEKVVELYENGELEVKPTETVEAKVEDTQTRPQEVVEVTEEQREDIDEAKEEDDTEEPASPSQSASSRATRWEALADIAAELPPSLAVDPVTGQIYALSKH